MAMQKYVVKLTEQERHELEHLISAGKASARKLLHARILLKADESAEGPAWPDQRISEALEVSLSTIARVRQRFVEQGLEEALTRRPQPERPHKRKLDGEVEAHLVALTCGPKPEGEGRWTVRLLAEKLVALGYVDQVSYETVRQALKKTN
jgi:transposase